MRLLLACSLSLALAASAALAQTGARTESAAPPSKAGAKPSSAKSPDQIKAIHARGAEYLAQCMQDWEPATHMSKRDWERTCRRVVQERVKFLLEQAQ
jgi:hypothetical protein